MKQNDLLTKLLLLCLIVVGSASGVWADPTYKSNFTDLTSDGNGNYYTYLTSSNYPGYITAGWMSYTGSSTGSATLKINPATDEAITGSSATYGKVKYDGSRYMEFYVTGVSDIKFYFANSGSNDRKIQYKLNGGNATDLVTVASKSSGSGSISLSASTDNTIRIFSPDNDVFACALKVTPNSGPAKAYTVTAASNNDSYGTASADASSLDNGETTTVTATPKTGYQFTSWSVEGEGSTLSSTTTNPTTLTMGTANTTVTATFSAINYAITHNPATGGTYTISVAGGEATSESTTATIGQTITLAGTPADPAKPYIRWNVKDAEDANVTVINNQFTMPAKAVTISPVFSKPLNTLFSMTNITDAGGDIAKGTTASVTATFSEGGSAEVYQNASSGNMLYNSSINLNGSGSSYIHVSFPSPLLAGDVITATFLSDGQAWKLSKTTSGAASKSNPYTIENNDALIGATDLYIFKDGSAQVSALKIEGDGEISDLAVTSSTTPTVAIGLTSAITTSTSSTGEITYTSSDTDVATVSSAGVITAVGGGTATITISQAADATYRPGSATVTVTVPETAIIRLTLPGGEKTGSASGIIGGTYDEKTQSRDATRGGCKLGSKGHFIGLTLATGNYFQAGDVVEVKFVGDVPMTGDASKVIFYDSKEQTNEIYNTGTSPELGTYRYVLPEAANNQSSLYLVRGNEINSSFNPYIDYIAVYRPDAIVTLNASGFATYSAGSDFIYAGADAYRMVLDLGEGTLTGAKIDDGTKIPAGAGILFKGEANGKIAIVNTNGATSIGDNSLKGTTDAEGNLVTKSGSNTFYALSGNHFKPYTGASFAANKAYFEVGPGEARNFTMTFEDGETTSIAGIETKKNMENMKFYNLNGQQVEAPTKGLYIVNGRKVVIK